MSDKTHMDSGRGVVQHHNTSKRSNAGLGGPKETVEERALTEENFDLAIPAPDSTPDEWANARQIKVRGESACSTRLHPK